VTTNRTRVLVVDDEESMREVLALQLDDWGFETRAASDGLQAKRLVESFEPDIVVADAVMPEISGLELLRSLKEGDPHRPSS